MSGCMRFRAGILCLCALRRDRFRTTLSLHQNTDMSDADIIQWGTKMLKSEQGIREQQPGAIAFRNNVRNQLAQAAARRQGLPLSQPVPPH